MGGHGPLAEPMVETNHECCSSQRICRGRPRFCDLLHEDDDSAVRNPQLLAKLVALDFAGRRARQIVGTFEPPRPLVGWQRPGHSPYRRSCPRSISSLSCSFFIFLSSASVSSPSIGWTFKVPGAAGSSWNPAISKAP